MKPNLANCSEFFPYQNLDGTKIEYAVDWDNNILIRRVSFSKDDIVYEFALIGEGEFEPWNGILPSVSTLWQEFTDAV